MEGRVITSETTGSNMKLLTHCQTNKTRLPGRVTMKRSQPVSLKTCGNNLQADKTMEVGVRIIYKKQSNMALNHSLQQTVTSTESDWE